MHTSVRVGDIIPDEPGAVALACASLGWRVLPLVNGTKKPRIRAWQKNATTDEEKIREWWSGSFRGSDVGVATGAESGIWVLDVDVKNGIDGTESLASLAAGRELPETFTVRSRSGRGLHMYWAWPGDDKITAERSEIIIGNTTGIIGVNLDTRGTNGQVRAPMKSSDVVVMTRPVEAPDWLLDTVTSVSVKRADRDRRRDVRRQYGWAPDAQSILRSAAVKLAATTAGGRNSALNTAAYLLALDSGETGITRDQAWRALKEACLSNGLWESDGLEQCAMTFASGWSAGIRDAHR